MNYALKLSQALIAHAKELQMNSIFFDALC